MAHAEVDQKRKSINKIRKHLKETYFIPKSNWNSDLLLNSKVYLIIAA